MKLFQTAKKKIWYALFILVPLLFFYQTIFFGKFPYPGDALVGDFEPYRSYSYKGYAPGSVPHKAQGIDVIKHMIPWKYFSIQSLKEGQIPFWNPHNFSGNPLMANFQSAVFYPLNFIFFILPFIWAWTVYIISTPILALLFTYLFLRNLGLSKEASFFGGMSFSFCLYMTVWLQWGNIGHTLIYLPLMLLLSDKVLKKFDYKLFSGLVLVGVFSILAGYIQGFFYIFCVTLFYFFTKGISIGKLGIRKSFFFLTGISAPLFLTAFQLFPTIKLYLESSRSEYSLSEIQTLLNPIYYLVTTFAPDFFGNPATRSFWFDGTYIERVSYFGVIPLFFGIFAIVNLFKKVEVKIFTFAMISSLILTTDFFLNKYFYTLPIPVISTTVPTRLLSIFAFSGSILAAFGMDYLIKNRVDKKILWASFLMFLFILFVFVITFFYPKFFPESLMNMSVAKRNLIQPLAYSLLIFTSLVLVLKKILLPKKIIIFALILLTVLELFYYFQKITPFSPKEYFYPATSVMDFIKKKSGIYRVWGYGSGYIEPNFQTFDGTYSPEGVDPIHIRPYTRLLESAKDGRFSEDLPRPDANIPKGYDAKDLISNKYRLKLLNVLGVKYILAKNQEIDSELFKKVWSEDSWNIYENLNVVPRIFMTNKYRIAKDRKEAISIFYDEEFDEKKELILFEDPKVEGSPQMVGEAKIVLYKPNEVVIEARSNTNALLFLSDTDYSGWQVWVDKKKDKIYTADYAFRAVSVPEGTHEIRFVYTSPRFYYGIYVSLISGSLFLGLLFYLKRKNYEI